MRLESIGSRVIKFHEAIRGNFSNLCRIAVALYDVETDLLQTFVSSTDGKKPFDHYHAALHDVPSLLRLREQRESRVVADFSVFADSDRYHSQRLLKSGVKSSYTVPMFGRDEFLGFIFFDADRVDYFSAPVVDYLSLYAQLVAALIANDLGSIRTLKGALMTAREFSRFRDEETADHLSRMSHYCRLIAIGLNGTHDLDDEYIEFLFQFSPLHDIGKVAVPDHILLKRGALAVDEQRIMRRHVEYGIEIVDTMIREFGFSGLDHIAILRNLVGTHHEMYDGSGYPAGLLGAAIPLEGRITAVADVFDALTSERPYKKAWSFEQGLEYLESHAETRFDPDCVRVVREQLDGFRAIHKRFNGAHY